MLFIRTKSFKSNSLTFLTFGSTCCVVGVQGHDVVLVEDEDGDIITFMYSGDVDLTLMSQLGLSE